MGYAHVGIIGDIMQRSFVCDAILVGIRISHIEITVYDTLSASVQDTKANTSVIYFITFHPD